MKDTKTKVYQEVLEKIRHYIAENNLQAGDRLPSERELAEQLAAGRSSVREALRAIELLGLIETRHGEGTFLRAYEPYYSVEILSTFLLQETRAQNEVLEMQYYIEKMILSFLSGKLSDEDYKQIRLKIEECSGSNLHTHFFTELFKLVPNRLYRKVWLLLDGFTDPIKSNQAAKQTYLNLLTDLKDCNIEQASERLHQLYVFDDREAIM